MTPHSTSLAGSPSPSVARRIGALVQQEPLLSIVLLSTMAAACAFVWVTYAWRSPLRYAPVTLASPMVRTWDVDVPVPVRHTLVLDVLRPDTARAAAGTAGSTPALPELRLPMRWSVLARTGDTVLASGTFAPKLRGGTHLHSLKVGQVEFPSAGRRRFRLEILQDTPELRGAEATAGLWVPPKTPGEQPGALGRLSLTANAVVMLGVPLLTFAVPLAAVYLLARLVDLGARATLAWWRTRFEAR